MKEIKAVIQPSRLARLREQFRKLPDFPGMTVTHAEGSGYHARKPQAQQPRSAASAQTTKRRGSK